jgi:hypothetical protein
MKILFKKRNSQEIAFEVEIAGTFASQKTQRGEAIRKALASGSDLRGCDLSHSNLTHSNLSYSDLSGCDLRGSDLSYSNLSHSDLSLSDLRGSNLSNSNLSYSNLSDSDLSDIPDIKDIHQTVFNAASKEGALDMSTWHANSCGTTHCRAGWVVYLAGPAGVALEKKMGTATAAALIYIKNDPHLEKVPEFYTHNEAALADMQKLAEAEAEAKAERKFHEHTTR